MGRGPRVRRLRDVHTRQDPRRRGLHPLLAGASAAGVADFLYGAYDGPDELVVLVIDSERVPAPVRFEAPEPGADEFPHIYGPLPVEAVTEVRHWGGGRVR